MNPKVLASYRELYRRAKAMTPPNADGGYCEATLRANLEAIIEIDENAERASKAKRVLDHLCRPDGEHDGQAGFRGLRYSR